MKKNLILMSALFAGSMIVNDGFGAKGSRWNGRGIKIHFPEEAVPVIDYVAMGTEMQNAFEAANSVIEHYADNPMEDPVAVYTAIVNFNTTYEARRNRQGVDRTTFDREFSHFPADLIKKFSDSVAAKAKKEYEAEILKKAECDNMDQMMKDIQDSRLFDEKMLYGYEVVDEEEVAESVAEEEEETNLTLMDSADTETSTLLEVNTKDLLCNAIVKKITSMKTFTEFVKTTDEMIKQYAKKGVEEIIDNKIKAPAPTTINAALKKEVSDGLNAAMAECQTIYKNKKAELTAKETQEISGSGKAMSSSELRHRRFQLKKRS